MKMKKTLSLILACFMFSTFAAACNGTGSGSGEYSGSGTGVRPGNTPTENFGGTGFGGGSGGGSSTGNLGDFESEVTGGAGGGNGNYEQAGSGGSDNKGSSNSGDYEGNYSGGSAGGSYVTPGDGGAGDVTTGGGYQGGEGAYTEPSGGSTGGNYETTGDGGAGDVIGSASSAGGDRTEFESATDTSYQGATTLVADAWRGQQGYNYFYYSQLGDDVMPIGAWCAPPPKFNTFTQDQITEENYDILSKSGINSIYALYDKALAPDYSDTLRALNACETVNAAYRAANNTENGKLVYLVKDSNSFGEIALDGLSAMDKYYSYMSHPAYGGTLFVDEPGYVEFETIGSAISEWKKHDLFGETKLALVNNLPNYASAAQLYYGAIPSGTPQNPLDYETWVEAFMQIVQPQVFSYDFYPFNSGTHNFTSGYYNNLSVVRKITQKYNVPFWIFAQAGYWNNNPGYDFTQAQMSFQINTALAYGAKGVQWFNYWHPLEFSASYTGGLVDHYGEKTYLYDLAVNTNAQVAAVDHVLMKSKSTGLIQIGNSPVENLPGSDIVSSYAALTSTSGSTGDAIVGCFEYRDKGYAYYVASNSISTATTVKLTFNQSYNLEKIYNAQTSTHSGSSIEVTLQAGEAALIVVYN